MAVKSRQDNGNKSPVGKVWCDMITEKPEELTSRKPLRVLPGVIAVALQWLIWYGVPAVAPEVFMVVMIGGLACSLAVLVWWLFFSRAPWAERLGAIALMVVSVIATKRIVHPSIAGGMMGMMLPIFSIPPLSLAIVVAAVVGRRLSSGPRRAVMVAAILLACAAFTLIRTGGMSGEGASDLHWRWTPDPEQRLLAQAVHETPPPPPATAAEPEENKTTTKTSDQPTVPTPTPAAAKTPEKSGADPAAANPAAANMDGGWPGFRGPRRDSVIHGVRIDTDWSRSKPVELWRKPIGPGWSSFAVHGPHI